MSEPHAVLGLDPQADASAIRKRYLELVRQFSPERDPARFAEIHAAYEELRDPVARMTNLLLHPPKTEGSIAEVLTDFRSRHRQNVRFPVATLVDIAEQLRS